MRMQPFFALFCTFLFLSPTIAVSAPVRVEGLVTDQARKPLADATVSLVRELPRYWLPSDIEPLAQARSDSSGRFRLEADIPPDTPVSLLASAPGRRLTRFCYDPVNSTQKVGLALHPGTSIRGQLFDQQNQPIAGALLGPILPAEGPEPRIAERIPPQWVRSADDGSFTFDNLMPGIGYQFLVRADGYESANVSAPAGASGLTLRLHPGGSSVSGEIISRAQPSSAFSGMKVRLNGNGFDMVAAANESGQFTLSGIPPGEYSLEAMPPGDHARRVALLTLPEHDGTTWPLEISSGYAIAGVVVDVETSTPVAGVPIRINATETTRGLEAVSGPDGRFLAGPFFTPGAPRIEVPEESGFVTLSDQGEAAIDYPFGDGFTDMTGVEIKVRRKRILRISLAGIEQTTQPVMLTLLGPVGGHGRAQRATATTASAEMTVYRGGEYRLWGRSGALATDLALVTVGVEPEIPLVLRLAPAARLDGRILVRTADGSTTRPAGYSIRVLAPGVTSGTLDFEPVPIRQGGMDPETAGRLVAEVSNPAADGSFLFPALPAGEVIVEARNRSGTRRIARPLQLAPGASQTMSFEFAPGKTLAGTVVTRDTRPVPAALVRVRIRGGASGAGREIALEADEQGRFRAEDLEADVAEMLYVDFHGFMPKRIGPFELPAEDIRIVLSKRGMLRVRVEDDPSTRWKIYLMVAEPWRRGTHPEQFMSHPSDSPAEVAGGESVELRVPDPGRFRIVAVGDAERVAVSDPFTWSQGDETDREIVVTPGTSGAISGTYQGEESAEVTAWNTALPEQGGVRTEFKAQGANGTFAFTDLPPGDYLVIAAGDTVYASAANVQVSAGGVTQVALESDTGGAPVRGVVRLGDKLVSGASLELVSQTDPNAPVHRTRSSHQGTFLFETVSADEYLVRVSFRTETGVLETQRPVTVTRRGEAPSVEIDIQPPQTVSVQAAQLARLGITAGSDVFFANPETRELIRARWSDQGELQAELSAGGTYEVWRGDEAVGQADVTEQGLVTVRLKQADR